MSSAKAFEIFCGTGGVGKTTLAASRAFHLAQKGHSVLLITIDPARRLKDFFQMSEDQSGEVIKGPIGEQPKLDVLLMNPQKTFQRALASTEGKQQSRILDILVRPYGGMNEILSLVELNHHFRSHHYQHIVLDTAPGGHFLDFLESSQKIQQFFDKKFIEIFNFLYQAREAKSNKRSLFKKIVSSGIEKLLGYLKKVTGEEFIDDFLGAIHTIYSLQEVFTQTLTLHSSLSREDTTNWYLVTSAEHGKAQEALDLARQAHFESRDNHTILINKCFPPEYTLNTEKLSSPARNIIEKLMKKEKKLHETLKSQFSHITTFPEILEDQTTKQLETLSQHWN